MSFFKDSGIVKAFHLSMSHTAAILRWGQNWEGNTEPQGDGVDWWLWGPGPWVFLRLPSHLLSEEVLLGAGGTGEKAVTPRDSMRACHLTAASLALPRTPTCHLLAPS